ncbi:tRNA threonylcarbamoyladenosine biosynthesis protein TsaE [Robiginitalea myxolifaciens]|uniref:tRNA threonylcarbamoyladenosine biosynthesis protein TsaE n=1 Tax=Robiginitalea myxolifaciens TaxID=400055 RepID=A0A1I6GWF2_9FLAO|nr:tRNA (adenosine(37)-N6)-threonylcarbamoyltransferase complex ATPase subunit type 1 TsaE [Robiginitalea myxolifaciens]SFR46510.1 tRNA threonylcarbamoyladenosine biosynthesis protein TsaE [Robiginitalea myxolifaciens]
MIIYYKLEEIEDIAKIILSFGANNICLQGQMGSGKTTLIRSIMDHLNTVDNVSSPTYGLLNQYQNSTGEVIGYHFDLFRVESQEELKGLDIETYLESPVLTFIEWPELIEGKSLENTLHINFSTIDNNKRGLEITRLS